MLRDKKEIVLRPGVALLSVMALLCLSLEIELLQQLDSLRLYLTSREIALEAGVALLLLLGLAGVWWLLVFALGQLAGIALGRRRAILRAHWDLWLGVPFSYLVFDMLLAVELEFAPHWRLTHSVPRGSPVALALLSTACIACVNLSALQNFCRTRLVPIAWLHVGLAVLAGLALRAQGVHLFHDYAHANSTVAVSNSPDIYLISVDALRADDMSLYGYNRPTTPNLEKFAGRSFTFDHFFANSNYTTPTTTSIETGKLPWSHRVFQVGGFLRDGVQHENLAEVLKHQGYYTAMISSNFLAAPFRHRTLESYDAVEYASPLGLVGAQLRYTNLKGVDSQTTLAFSLIQGLHRLCWRLDGFISHSRYPSPPETVFDRARVLLGQINAAQPLFLWTHILAPHDPYWPPASFRHRFLSGSVERYDNFVVSNFVRLPDGVTVEQLRASYDEMILYADSAVGDFLDWLDRTGRLDRSIVIVSADHGESFDHGRLGHGGPLLYNGLIHIPLLLHLPGQKRGARIGQLAQQADLLPTILELVGVRGVSWTDGLSLKPALEGSVLPERYVFSMNLETQRMFDPVVKGTVAVMDGEFALLSYLDSGKEELYRYNVDSSEENDLIGSNHDVADRMRGVLSSKLKEVNNGRLARKQ